MYYSCCHLRDCAFCIVSFLIENNTMNYMESVVQSLYRLNVSIKRVNFYRYE